MAKIANKLTAKQVQSLPAGLHSDGGNLYVRVRVGGSRQFVMIYKAGNGKQRELSLGGAHAAGLTLAEARSRAERVRYDLRDGFDPLELRRTRQREISVPIFGDFADQFIASREASWKNDKHRAQWRMTMTVYAAPLRKLAVDQIRTDDIEKILSPIWLKKHETATRVRSRIEMILNSARVMGHISKDAANPARWKGHLDLIMPKRSKALNGHHAAMAYEEVPDFVALLRSKKAISSLALELLILTAARSNEILHMTWPEIDRKKKIWTIPASRMKGEIEHLVPICSRAEAILAIMDQQRDGDNLFVFPGQRRNRPLSDMSLEMLLRRMEVTDATPHGFRSSFRDWAGDETDHSEETIEACLAHKIGDDVRNSYRRKSALKKRTALMEQWEKYCLQAISISLVDARAIQVQESDSAGGLS